MEFLGSGTPKFVLILAQNLRQCDTFENPLLNLADVSQEFREETKKFDRALM